MKTVYYNAQVYTGLLPLQQAFAVEDGKFIFAGSNSDALALHAEQSIDLQGAFVCAGFNDSHMHLLNLGQTLGQAPLYQHTGSLQDMLDCLHQTAPSRGGWILGRGWNQDYFADVNRMPNRYDLDKVSTEHPICISRTCGHALAVNSKALEILGINADTPQVEGGSIVMEAGEPNGIFFDNAMDLVLRAIPDPNKEEIKDMLRAACGYLSSYGITSCQSDDYCVFQNLSWQVVNDAYRELEEAGELTVRVYEQANLTTVEAIQDFLAAGNKTGIGTDRFKIGPLKLLGDGALGARTAYLSKPYADDPSTRGLSVFTAEQFDALIGIAHENGMQVAVHCIGDACMDLVLSAMEKAMAAHPRQDCRHGIVHCQITRGDQLKKLSQMGLHIYAQSIFLDYDIHIVRQRVGDETASTSYSWKTLLNTGCTVSNGSDCPVERPNVMGGIQCAVTRRDLSGNGPYLPHEAFSVQQALDSFTAWAAYASFEEHRKGKIQPGMLADFVVLEENPFEVPTTQIKDIPIVATYLGGQKIFG